MTQANHHPQTDGTDSNEQDRDDETESPDPCSRHDATPITQETRTEVLSRDGHRCQVCGREGPERGGLATLHVHHIERDPDSYDENEPANLSTLCRSCHNWVHQQATRDDAPVSLSEADLSVLLPQDIEILRFLADEGPARTGDIATELSLDLSVTAVRERLCVLMGLDNLVESRDRQIVDKDLQTGEWGLTEHIENSARGHIPDDPRLLLQRIEDEQVRRALERGCDRESIMAVVDVSRRTTFNKEKRAHAYDFPLSALRRRGLGGRYPATDVSESGTELTSDPDRESESADLQQRLDTLGHDTGGRNQAEPTEGDESIQDSQQDTSDALISDDDEVVVREQLQTAITALQRITDEL